MIFLLPKLHGFANLFELSKIEFIISTERIKNRATTDTRKCKKSVRL